MMKYVLLTILSVIAISGCSTTENHRTLVSERSVVSVTRSSTSVQIPVAIGNFANQSSFNNGIFSSGKDQLTSQAVVILQTYLQQAGCYRVLDRTNMGSIEKEAALSNKPQKIQGAKYVITGDIVEFGRKDVGDHQLWGILGHGKTQVAYAKVNLNVVDVTTSAVVQSATGTGEYELSSRDVLGFGSTAGYDSTLNGKVLGLAIREAVNDLTNSVDNGLWRP